MRSSVLLAAGPGFSIDAVTCVDDHRGWSPAEVGTSYRVVLVRRGTFRRMANGRPAVADPTMAYLGLPGDEEHFAHPSGGDVCTSLSLSPALWHTLTCTDTPTGPLASPAAITPTGTLPNATAITPTGTLPSAITPTGTLASATAITPADTLTDATTVPVGTVPVGTVTTAFTSVAITDTPGDAAPKALKGPLCGPLAVTSSIALTGTPARSSADTSASALDATTVCTLTGAAADAGTGGGGVRPSRSTLYVDARLDLAHRRVLRAARDGDTAFELTESLLRLLSQALGPIATTPEAGGAAAAITGTAREAITAGHPAATGLLPLAALLNVSPYRLSRAFTRELGISLTHYRNRVRVGQALDRLEQGEASLATLAADLGFSDQAHLTRTIRRHLGHTPTAVRRLLPPPPGTATPSHSH
ncbi:AraC-type DNA-binding protein [Nonomuraea solani]|uniref:AraC-type DNA-binding protein n=1 Tax=Nonomuraea solani TaxID=1144553 RepID=A0A1H6F2D8_9ACTN|nr:helix-turn-helix domain-containing protein [Nonomuraea solani]SEH03306.1 AraC-type DNA-binding protein [Nonomuraea solani]